MFAEIARTGSRKNHVPTDGLCSNLTSRWSSSDRAASSHNAATATVRRHFGGAGWSHDPTEGNSGQLAPVGGSTFGDICTTTVAVDGATAARSAAVSTTARRGGAAELPGEHASATLVITEAPPAGSAALLTGPTPAWPAAKPAVAVSAASTDAGVWACECVADGFVADESPSRERSVTTCTPSCFIGKKYSPTLSQSSPSSTPCTISPHLATLERTSRLTLSSRFLEYRYATPGGPSIFKMVLSMT
mmetsp:Transcript_18078/g.51444  ORF Transcript_18078/g.51444 Transcript_18078/m.51444 type:complete len:247 (+) Transcript_18078:142-882(+)